MTARRSRRCGLAVRTLAAVVAIAVLVLAAPVTVVALAAAGAAWLAARAAVPRRRALGADLVRGEIDSKFRAEAGALVLRLVYSSFEIGLIKPEFSRGF